MVPLHWLSCKESAYNAGATGDIGWIPGLGSSPGGEHGNPLQYPCLRESHGQRSLVGYSLWGYEELDITKATEHAPTEHVTGDEPIL